MSILRSDGDVTIRNAADATIGEIYSSVYRDTAETSGGITILNEGTIIQEVLDNNTRETGINLTDLHSQYWQPTENLVNLSDHIYNSGNIYTDVSLHRGNDTFATIGDSVVTGDVDGGIGIDSMILHDYSGIISAYNFFNFELLDISTNSTATIHRATGLRDTFTDITVRQGEVHIDTDIAPNITVLEAGKLSGSAEISGNVESLGVMAPGSEGTTGQFSFGGNVTLAETSRVVLKEQGAERDSLTFAGGLEANGFVDLFVSGLESLDLNIDNYMSISDFEGSFQQLNILSDPALTVSLGVDAGVEELFSSIAMGQGLLALHSDVDVDVELGSHAVLTGNGAINGDVSVEGLIAPGTLEATGRITFDGQTSLVETSRIFLREQGADRDFIGFNNILAADGFVDLAVSGLETLDLDISSYLGISRWENAFQQLNILSDPALTVSLGTEAGLNGLFSSISMEHGQLAVQSDFTLDVVLGINTILSGNGTIQGDVSTDGVIAPGASIGHLTIDGDLVLGESAVLEVEVQNGTSDLLTVSGDASLNGVLMVNGSSLTPSQTHTLQFMDVAGARTGEFSDYLLETNGAFSGSIELQSTSSGEVQLVLTPELATGQSLSENAGVTAAYLNSLISSNASSAQTDAIIEGLFDLGSNTVALDSALMSMDSGVFAGATVQGLEQSRLVQNELLSRSAASGDTSAGRQYWMSGIHSLLETDDDEYGADFELTNSGVMAGIDFLAPGRNFGFYAAYIDSSQDFLQRPANLEGESVQVGTYGGWQGDALTVSGTVGYSQSSINSERSTAFMAEQLTSDVDLSTLSVATQAKYNIGDEKHSFAPVVGVSYYRIDRDSVQENGGSAALSLGDDRTEFAYFDFGGEFDAQLTDAVSVELQALYSYELFGQTPGAKASFVDLNGTNAFAGTVEELDRNRFIVNAAADYSITDNFSFFGGVELEMGEKYSSQRFEVGVIAKF